MDRPDDTAKPRSRRNQLASAPDVSAERRHALRCNNASKAQRAQLLQAHGVLWCLHEALLYADDQHAVLYAGAAECAARIVNRSVEELDPVRIGSEEVA